MLSEEDLCKVRYVDYWKRPYGQWGIDTWNSFFCESNPDTSWRMSRISLAAELKVLISNLNSETKEGKKVLALKRQLKKSGKSDKENQVITYTKRKVIEKIKLKKKSKTIKKNGKEKAQPEEDSTISTTTSKISLSEIVLNTIPNLVYLDLYNKSNLTTESTEQRFPDKIMNWLEFEQEVQIWQPEANKKYSKPIFTNI